MIPHLARLPSRDADRRVYTVAELTRAIRAALERAVGSVWVEGEVSNLRRPASGHLYFTLKDESAQIAAVLFRGSQRGLAFQPRDGDRVRLFGDLSVYERSGQYQIVVRVVEPAGKGDLQARFEALKRRLQEEGLFDPARKRPLPLLPQHVGVVTSATGAAIRDILKVLARRFPNLHLVLAPARVQGEGAADDVAAAIDLLNARGGLDVLIVGRGGGSAEDLWCFNEEAVARAIARSRIPVISAVGHEIDFTIADFVADVRAPTPSAAAEIVVGRKEEFAAGLAEAARALRAALRARLLESRNRLLAAAGSRVFREPAHVVRQHLQRLDAAALRMEHALRSGAQGGRERARGLGVRMGHELQRQCERTRRHVDELALRAAHALRARGERARQDLRRLETQARALSPLAVLDRGYSITCDASGRALRSASAVRAGQRVRTRLSEGSFASRVEEEEAPAGGDAAAP